MSKSYTFLDLKELNRPYMDEIRSAADRVVASGRYIGGPEVDAFEATLAEMTGTAHAIGVSNGLDALRLIFRALVQLDRLCVGDEVLVPANTYIASVLAVTDAGLKPVPVDIDPDTSNMSVKAVMESVTPHTRAILPVHLYGRVCWSDELRRLSQERELLIVEDNAQAIGARSRVAGLGGGFCTGSLGHAAAFSFYPTKNVGALGDAGAITTDDAELAAAVRALANYGSNRRYHNIYAGFNCRLDPVQAAVLNVKLPFTWCINSARAEIANIYLREIVNPLVKLPAPSVGGDCVWHQFVVRTAQRDVFRDYLAANGVSTDINYPTPPHKQPCYAATMGNISMPEAEEQACTLLCLPVSGCTSPADAGDIAAIINKYSER